MKQFEETLLGRIDYPDELKGTLLFLASQANGRSNEQDLLVDGAASPGSIQQHFEEPSWSNSKGLTVVEPQTPFCKVSYSVV
jgi:hypothetical protein